MKLLRSTAFIFFVTFMALTYVHQQVELVKLSYSIGKKEMVLKDMLDRKDRLGYNVNDLESPSRLEKTLLSRKVDIAYPKRANIVKMAKLRYSGSREDRIRSIGVEKKFNLFGIPEFLSPRAEAQVKQR
ncbi:MAG: hypothetical protein WC738_04735 [Candidatus Omnitrophota bacterium]|jgi:hypothetical protein